MEVGEKNKQTIVLRAFVYHILCQKQKTSAVEYHNIFQQLSFSLQERHSQSLLQLPFKVYANTHTRTDGRNWHLLASLCQADKSALRCSSQKHKVVIVSLFSFRDNKLSSYLPFLSLATTYHPDVLKISQQPSFMKQNNIHTITTLQDPGKGLDDSQAKTGH